MSIITAIRGFKDILPEETPIWRKVEKIAMELADLYDFKELRIPIMEKTNLFARGIGETTDIVEKEMYTLSDRNGEKLTLRPEGTASLARAVLENNLIEEGKATKLIYIGPMFRYERPQKGRQRQFHQLDVEVFGDPGPYVDADVLAYLHTFLTKVGLDKLTINLNSLGCPECRPAFKAKLIEFLSKRRSELCEDCQRRLELNPLRVIDCKVESCRSIVAGAPKTTDNLCLACEDHFSTLGNILNSINLKYEVNPYLVRGLDYYTRTAFEVISGDLGSQNAVAGGGRYDGLCEAIGGPSVPGIGFALGLERLTMLLQNTAKDKAPDFYVAPLCPEAVSKAFEITEKLRCKNYKVACDYNVASLKSRLKRADRLSVEKIVMLGPDELAKGEVTIRNLITKEQKNIAIDDIQSY